MPPRPRTVNAQSAMRFTNLKLESWKNFKKVDVPLSDRLFIIGPNASGKSNFLEVFRFLHDLVTEGGGLAKAVSLREGMSKLRSLHATGNSAVEIEVTMVSPGGIEWRYRLAFDTAMKKSTEPIIQHEEVYEDGREVLKRPNAADVSDKERLKQTAIEQISANKDFRVVAEFFRSIRYMNLVPQLIREGHTSPNIYPGRDPLGRDLLDQMGQTPSGRCQRRLAEIGKTLKRVVPDFVNLRLEKDNRGRPHLAVGFKHWRQTQAKQRESQFSDGTLRLIAMLWSMQEEAGPLLMEEPEWSLHGGILERLAPYIARMQRLGGGRQVFITTHNERLLGDPGISPKELLLVLPASKGGSEVKVGVRLPIVVKAMKSGLSAAEAAQPLTRMDTMRLFAESA